MWMNEGTKNTNIEFREFSAQILHLQTQGPCGGIVEWNSALSVQILTGVLCEIRSIDGFPPLNSTLNVWNDAQFYISVAYPIAMKTNFLRQYMIDHVAPPDIYPIVWTSYVYKKKTMLFSRKEQCDQNDLWHII